MTDRPPPSTVPPDQGISVQEAEVILRRLAGGRDEIPDTPRPPDDAAAPSAADGLPPTRDASAAAERLLTADELRGLLEAVPDALVARMEAAVNQGDYAKALSEYETLPEAAKAAGADFAGKLKARIEVETQVDALISGAMKA